MAPPITEDPANQSGPTIVLRNGKVWPAGGRGDELVAVDVGFNLIQGQLPAKLAGYPSLVALTASHNQLRGVIPWQYLGQKKGASFRRLFLDGNFLYGRVPPELIEGGMTGSFGDNCLEGCPLASALCSPRQKPGWICKSVYSGDGPRRQGDTMGV
ncbi:hypothetical protein KSP39_PZI015334 [Platanthera zijinensis]|uniref:Uncharacterized protein n=1 Tax=Platanthera zijinensis TaxID=2320716 RepID=A0AAP0G270_9ASPA